MVRQQRWSIRETRDLQTIRERLKDELANAPQFPEVVGDRRLLRFLRGKQNNLDEAVTFISNMLAWRRDNDIDMIRQDIVYNGVNSPKLFPHGEKILKMVPQIVISALNFDSRRRPLVLESYNFNPNDLLEHITIEEYMKFLIYSLEYRTLVMEVLADRQEQEALVEMQQQKLEIVDDDGNEEEEEEEGYGVLLYNVTLRDLSGVGFDHLGANGRAIVSTALGIGLPNYPDVLGTCYMINVPWIFNSLWIMIKAFLDPRTLAKINFCGSSSDALSELNGLGVPSQCVPVACGGTLVIEQVCEESFDFSEAVQEGGPLWYSGAPPPPVSSSVPSSLVPPNNSKAIPSAGIDKKRATCNAQPATNNSNSSTDSNAAESFSSAGTNAVSTRKAVVARKHTLLNTFKDAFTISGSLLSAAASALQTEAIEMLIYIGKVVTAIGDMHRQDDIQWHLLEDKNFKRLSVSLFLFLIIRAGLGDLLVAALALFAVTAIALLLYEHNGSYL